MGRFARRHSLSHRLRENVLPKSGLSELCRSVLTALAQTENALTRAKLALRDQARTSQSN